MASSAFAVEPGEMLSDPFLEARAREISKELRCPVCRNENIDESHSTVSGDLRRLVRERLVVGDTDDEVIAYVVGRYNEYVLLKPQSGGINRLLWWAGPLMLLAAIGAGFAYLRGRTVAAAPAPLDPNEEARLRELTEK
ncbi:MAG: cytochrome c-type biogenesis protein CcmH [Halocynthiibacter sp.]|jgi:cytochrome c-type biogenesis protein CcmH